jgi:glucose/arabinose dehydrogenase
MKPLASIIAFSFAVCSASAWAQDIEVGHEVLVADLAYPWSLAFLSAEEALVTQKNGRLSRLDLTDGGLTPISGTPDVLHSGQGGLMDVVLHPEYGTTGFVYLTWSAGRVHDNTLMLGRGQLVDNTLIDFETLFIADPRRQTDVHYGARLAFLPDGSILLGIGEGFDYREQAQRPQSHLGSIVHLNDDGQPFESGFVDAAPGVYSIGHRNPQAIVHDVVTGLVYSNEHGPRGGDEINIIEEGRNYGWPITSHGIDYSGALVTPFTQYEDMTDPILSWTPSIAPSGMAIYHGETFSEWDGDLLVSALIAGDADVASGHIRRVEMENGVVIGQEILLGELGARMRDVRVAPDGQIYVLTDAEQGQVLRLVRD